VIKLRRISFFLVLGLVIISLVGCGEMETREKTLSDGSKVTVDATGKIREVMMEDIGSKLLEGYEQVAAEEVKNQSGYELVTPKYLPERFQYHGIFMRDNPGIPTEKMVKQLWYDPEKFEVLMVTQMRSDATSSLEEQIIFTDELEAPGKISDIYPWTKYRCQYEFTKNGIHVQGYMLVNDESNRDEYEKILKSLNDKSQALEGYIYDEQTGRYINETTGIWYIVKNGYKIIPPEEYFDPNEVGTPSGINISNRPDDVWELKEIRDITVKEGDTLSTIITQYSINHFRMNRDWYSKQVLELNNITDPHFIRAGDTLKIPIYIDIGSKNTISLEEIIKKHIPKPFNPKVHSNSLEFTGRWKGNVIPGFIQEMKKMGWVELEDEQMGAMRYFTKEIDDRKVKISVVPGEKGGPEEENATTFIYFRVLQENER
jgi:hypothetical protein